MIIDFHTHMFPDKIAKGTLDFLESVCKTHPYTDGTSEGLNGVYGRSGDRHLCGAAHRHQIVPVRIHQPVRIRIPGGKDPFFWRDPSGGGEL